MNPRILIYLNILFFLTFLYSSDLHPPSRDCIEDDFGDCCDEPFQVWYDEDNDGLGDPENSALACLEYANWVTNNDDPNDNCFSNIIDCNGTCNGTWVEDFFGDCCEETTTMWQDFDYDGWGNFNVSVETCQFYVGWVYNYVDKNDSTFCQSNVFDACGICDGDNSSCTGCTDPEAINYEVENEIDDDSCVYPSDHIWHVSLLGSDETGTGTVENPFFTVNRGIEASSDSDTILVHTGIHYGTVNFSGKNVLLTTLFEFTGDSTHLFNTILDGNDEVTVVRFENGENEEAVISGFSIRNGYGNLGPGGQNFLGGGIICTYSSPTIRNLLIYDNYADYGGGIFLWHYSNANIHDISVYDNLASVGGGLCFHWDCNPLVENFLVRNNHATVDAGGVSYEKYCSGIIRNGIIKNNSTTLRGGAMLIWDGSHPVLENLQISNNVSGANSGGILIDHYCNPVLNHVQVTGNSVTSNSGEGGGLYIYAGSNVRVINSTIADNWAEEGGGVFFKSNGSAIFVNSIIYGNQADQIHFMTYGSITLAYSDIEGGIAGIHQSGDPVINWLEGNIDEDPLFTSMEFSDFSLLEDSPCIDAGTDFFQFNGETLVDMTPDQYYGEFPDMGAIETVYDVPPGDVNHDNIISINDLIILVNYIFEGAPNENAFYLADMNGDGILNILDIVLLLNIILGEGPRNFSSSGEVQLIVTDKVEILTNGGVAAIQLEFSGNYAIDQIYLNDEWSIDQDENSMLIYNTTGAELGSCELFSFRGDLEITETIAADWNGKKIPVIFDQPSGFRFNPAWPNPFNPTINFSYNLDKSSQVSLVIFDLNGRKVKTLISDLKPAGVYSFAWTANGLASGVYLARLQAGEFISSQKIVLLK